MRLLITGAAGVIGRRLCAAAIERGHDVVAVDRRPSGLLSPRLREVVADVRSLSVDDLLPDTDAFVHLATAKPNRPGDERNPAVYAAVVQDTLEGARHALRIAEAAGVARFIHASSMTVHGAPLLLRLPRPEDTLDPRPGRRGLYAHSKIAAEAAVHEFAANPHRCELCVLRFALVCGPGMGHDAHGEIEPGRVLRSMLISTAKLLPVGAAIGIGRRDHGAPLLDIRDLIEGLLALAAQPSQAGALRVWDVQSGEPPDKRRLLSAVAGALQRRDVQLWPPAPAALGAAALIELAMRAAGRRTHLRYRVTRAYRFNAAELSHDAFWRDVGVRPEGDLRSCLAVAALPDLAHRCSADPVLT